MKNISKKDFIITVVIIISCAIVGEIFTYKMATESNSKDISSINGKASTFAIGSGTFVTLSDHNNELQAQRTSGYNEGYNAGVAAADARSNSSSTNYQSGYTAGLQQGKNVSVNLKIAGENGGDPQKQTTLTIPYGSSGDYSNAPRHKYFLYVSWNG